MVPKFSAQQLRAIKQSPKGKLPKFIEQYTEVGNKKAGASLLRTKDGSEIQAGIGRTHLDAGYSKKNRTAGLHITRTSRSGKTRSFGGTIKY